MPDWTKSMQQSYEYYTVEPTTLADVKRLDNVKKASFSKDSDSETLGSATIDVTNSVGESYIRGYLKTIQNGVTEKFPLGMVLSQTPSSSFNGKILDVSMDCYTPLIELKEKKPPLGYTIRKGTRIMDAAYRIVRENCRVPVNKVEPDIKKSKNLIDSNSMVAGYIDASSGHIASPYSIFNEKTTDYIPVTPGTITTFQIWGDAVGSEYFWYGYLFYDKDKNPIGKRISSHLYEITGANQHYETTISIVSDAAYIRLSARMFTNVTLQLELGSTATSYEAYFEPIDRSPTLQHDFVANTDDTWLSFVIDLIANAKYELGLGELGDVLFLPKQDLASLQPVWTYNDGNSSILYPELSMDHDLYGIPNVVEVIYSYGSDYKQAVAKNEDPNSPISTVSRGREIVHRVTDPSLAGYVTQDQIQDYAERLLKELSTIEYKVSYTHAYCPVRVGDCVRLNYKKAGIMGIKAKVISQNISCEPGCPVSEKAVFTSKLWR